MSISWNTDIKKLVFIFLLISLAGCSPYFDTATPIKAVYLTHGPSELSQEDLQKHPEVIVVQTFDDFKKHASRKTALWIDKSATPFNEEQEKWINDAPQAYDPIVLVGISDPLHSFRDLLSLCCFMGPIIEWKTEPGFSVIQRQRTPDPNLEPIDVSFIQGYNQKPTVESILEITNALLENRVQPTSIATLVP